MTVVHREIDTADLDEATEVFRAAYTGGGLRPSDTDEDFRYIHRFAGRSSIGVVQHAVGARVDSRSEESDTLFVAWTDDGETTYWLGRRELTADAGILWSGRRPAVATVRHASIGIDRDEFETRARLLLGRPDFFLPDLVPLPSPAHLALLRRELDSLRARLGSDPELTGPLLARTAFDHTVAVVLTAAGLDDQASRAAPSSAVLRAEVYIDENLHRPISIADIAAAAGLSARGLQSAFRREIGEPPMQYTRRVRLEQVHRELLAADVANSSVAEIAQRWGFTHLGRFAHDYRSAYGTRPSHDLHR